MDMTSHETIRVDFKTFVFLAISDAVNNDRPILITNEDINPVNYGEGHKIDAGLVVNFILAAHTIKATGFTNVRNSQCGPGCEWEEIRKKCLSGFMQCLGNIQNTSPDAVIEIVHKDNWTDLIFAFKKT